jgi:hypothetical protein
MIVATDNSMKKKSSVVASELLMSRYALAILVHAALIAFWYLVVRYGKIPPFILPGPIETISTLNGSNYHWINNALVTATEIFGGYILAITIGVGLATVLSWSNIATLVVMPLLVTLNMVPKVALGPLFIVWLSYGILSNAVIAFLRHENRRHLGGCGGNRWRIPRFVTRLGLFDAASSIDARYRGNVHGGNFNHAHWSDAVCDCPGN